MVKRFLGWRKDGTGETFTRLVAGHYGVIIPIEGGYKWFVKNSVGEVGKGTTSSKIYAMRKVSSLIPRSVSMIQPSLPGTEGSNG